MNEETVKLFHTISKIAGFNIKPDQDFYILKNGRKCIYSIDVNLLIWYKLSHEYYAKTTILYTDILDNKYILKKI